MEGVAHARFVRVAPRKVEVVLDTIRGKRVDQIRRMLPFVPKGTVPIVRKVLQSAVSNTGTGVAEESLVVSQAWVGQGPSLKRMRAGSMGRGMPYRRKTCHITIVVSDRRPGRGSEG